MVSMAVLTSVGISGVDREPARAKPNREIPRPRIVKALPRRQTTAAAMTDPEAGELEDISDGLISFLDVPQNAARGPTRHPRRQPVSAFKILQAHALAAARDRVAGFSLDVRLVFA
jgi:hypothetical protein